MSKKTFFDFVVRDCRTRYVPLFILLVLVAVCLGREGQAGTRRTPRVPRLKMVQLPEPATSSAVSLEQALVQQQQQTTLPGEQRLRSSDISQLVWAAQGVRVSRGAAATATATPAQAPPMKVYLVLADGIYVYDPLAHALEQARDEDARQALAVALLNQPTAPAGGAHIILAGSSRDFAAQYGARARTAMLLQAGQMVQNIQLQAIALGLTFIAVDSIDSGSVRRVLRLPRNLEPLYVNIVGYPATQTVEGIAAEPVVPQDRKALIVVPPQGYHDQELIGTKRALELAGVPAPVASLRLGPLTGTLGGTVNAELLLNQVNVSEYSAVVFIGGLGAVDYFSNRIAQDLARQAAAQGKVLAAIGTAPSILANAGVLKGVRATAYLSEQARLVQGGASYTGNPVEKDGSIVTATGPLAVDLFATAILEALSEG